MFGATGDTVRGGDGRTKGAAVNYWGTGFSEEIELAQFASDITFPCWLASLLTARSPVSIGVSAIYRDLLSSIEDESARRCPCDCRDFEAP